MSSNPKGYQKGDETPTGALKNDLLNKMAQWEELGIDPDDFLKCAICHKFFRDLVEGTLPTLTEEELCQGHTKEEIDALHKRMFKKVNNEH